MIARILQLPRFIWVKDYIFEEASIVKVKLIDVTYDKMGLKQCHYQTYNGSLYVWCRDLTDSTLFETMQEAIDSVENNNYLVSDKW